MSDVTLLKDISAKITKGTTPSTVGNEFKAQGITFFKAQSIDDEGRVVKGNLAYIDDETDEKLKRSRIVQDDLLITIAGTIGRVHRVNDKYTPANCNQAVAIVRLNQLIDSKYVYYALRSPKVQGGFLGRVVHAVQANLSLTEIGLTEIYFPGIEFRESIAEVLSSIDDKIDLLNRQNETLEAMAQTLFRQWFIEEADDSWEITTIGTALRTVLGGTPKTSIPEYWNGDIPWINSGEVNRFRISEGSKYITELALKKSNTKLLPKRTTVIAITGATLGQISLLEIDTCANQSVIGIIPNQQIPYWYVYLWINHVIGEIVMNETGGAQGHINKGDLNSTRLIIPSKAKLDDTTGGFDTMFEKISLNILEIKSLTSMRNTLLPKLMSGEVRVKLD